jgi:hypothetical protein
VCRITGGNALNFAVIQVIITANIDIRPAFADTLVLNYSKSEALPFS